MMEKLVHHCVCRLKDSYKICMDVKLMCGHLVSYYTNLHMADCLWNIVQLKKC